MSSTQFNSISFQFIPGMSIDNISGICVDTFFKTTSPYLSMRVSTMSLSFKCAIFGSSWAGSGRCGARRPMTIKHTGGRTPSQLRGDLNCEEEKEKEKELWTMKNSCVFVWVYVSFSITTTMKTKQNKKNNINDQTFAIFLPVQKRGEIRSCFREWHKEHTDEDEEQAEHTAAQTKGHSHSDIHKVTTTQWQLQSFNNTETITKVQSQSFNNINEKKYKDKVSLIKIETNFDNFIHRHQRSFFDPRHVTRQLHGTKLN